MFAKLEFATNTPLNDVLESWTSLICGELDLNNLPGVVVGNSYINTDLTTSPWELWDDVSGSQKIIRTQQTDSGEYKYIGLHHNSGPLTGPSYAFSIMTDWDEVLHTGTDVRAAEYTYIHAGQRQQVANFWWYIYADEFMIYIMPHSDYNLVGASSGSNTDRQSLFHGEVSRDNPSMKLGDMPNYFIAVTTIFGGEASQLLRPCYFPKGRNYLGNDVVPCRVHAGTPARGQYVYTTYQWTPDTIGTIKSPEVLSGPTAFPVEPLVTCSSNHNGQADIYDYAGSISERCDIWSIPTGSVSIFDQLIFKGKAYICLKAGHSSTTSGLDIGAKVMVPYG